MERIDHSDYCLKHPSLSTANLSRVAIEWLSCVSFSNEYSTLARQKRARARERERERETDRQTDRQTEQKQKQKQRENTNGQIKIDGPISPQFNQSRPITHAVHQPSLFIGRWCRADTHNSKINNNYRQLFRLACAQMAG